MIEKPIAKMTKKELQDEITRLYKLINRIGESRHFADALAFIKRGTSYGNCVKAGHPQTEYMVEKIRAGVWRLSGECPNCGIKHDKIVSEAS